MNYANVTVFDRYDQLVVMAIVRAPLLDLAAIALLAKPWALRVYSSDADG